MKLSDLNPGDYEIEQQETPSIESVPVESTSSPLKLSQINDYEIESQPEPVSVEELEQGESLADKAYRLADVAGEGLLRGWKSEIQSGIENVALPYYLGREFDYKDVLPFLKTDEEKADDLSAQREGFERYEPSKQKYEEFTEQTKEMMPRASYATELGGALLPYALGGPGAGIAANAALGGVEGAVTAGGKSEAAIGSDEFLKDAATGGAIGATLGGVGTKLMKVAPKVATAGLVGAGATPLLTGEVDPTQMAAGGGTAALLAALASRGRGPAAQKAASGLVGKAYQYGKEGLDLISDDALAGAKDKVIKNATEVAESVKTTSNVAGKNATDTIFQYFDDQIQQLGDTITKGAADKDSTIRSLKTKVWKDLESNIQKFKAAHPDREVDIGDIFESTVQSLRKGVKESLTDPAEIQAANKTIDIINKAGKIKDSDISVTIKEMLSPLSEKPQITSLVEGVDDPVEAAVLRQLSPEDLQKAGFEQTVKPFKTVEKPASEITTTGISAADDSLVTRKAGDTLLSEQRTVFGKAPVEGLEQQLDTPFDPVSRVVDGEELAPSAFASRTSKPEQVVETTNKVFQKLFPGRSDLKNVSLDEILQANTQLNDVIRSSKSDFTKRVLLNAKDQLAQREQQLVSGTQFKDVVTRRELYGTLKDAEKMFGTETTADLFKLVDDMYSAKQQGRFSDYQKAFNSIKTVNPEYASNLENLLLEKGGIWRNLIARQKANPAEKLQALTEEGIQLPKKVQSAGQTLQELEALKKSAGTIDPTTGRPTTEAFKFAQNLGELRGTKAFDPKLKAQLDDAINIIKDFDPDLAQKLSTEGAKDADILRITQLLRGESDLGFIPSTFQGALIKTLQVFGIPKVAYYLGKGTSAAQKGVSNVTTGVFKPVEAVKNALNTEVNAFGKFDRPLKNAAQRGDGALRATIYMLSQQYPEFREYMNQFEDKE